MNDDQKRSEVDELTELLVRMRPARGQLDSRVVFYEAGFGAAQSASARRRRMSSMRTLIAASLLVVATASLAYRVGQETAFQASLETKHGLATDAVPDPGPVLDTSESSQRRVMPETPRVLQAPESTPAAKPGLYAQWIHPLLHVENITEVDLGAETTLAAYHGSRVLDRSGGQWLNFPPVSAAAATTDLSNDNTSLPASGDGVPSPLSAGDLHAMANSLEVSR